MGINSTGKSLFTQSAKRLKNFREVLTHIPSRISAYWPREGAEVPVLTHV